MEDFSPASDCFSSPPIISSPFDVDSSSVPDTSLFLTASCSPVTFSFLTFEKVEFSSSSSSSSSFSTSTDISLVPCCRFFSLSLMRFVGPIVSSS